MTARTMTWTKARLFALVSLMALLATACHK
jgi:hypothetical protein